MTHTDPHTAALTAVAAAEVSIRHTGPTRYVNESRHPATWSTDDVAALIASGHAVEGRDYVHLTRLGHHAAGS